MHNACGSTVQCVCPDGHGREDNSSLSLLTCHWIRVEGGELTSHSGSFLSPIKKLPDLLSAMHGSGQMYISHCICEAVQSKNKSSAEHIPHTLYVDKVSL